MPTLSEVIDTFNQGFKYLGKDGKRNSKWYEFGFSQLSDPKLTADIEQVAKNLQAALGTLQSKNGDESFEDDPQKFKTPIIKALKEVLVKRFAHGKVVTINENQSIWLENDSILERHIIPKKQNYFEEMIRRGLDKVTSTYPTLSLCFKGIYAFLENPPNLTTEVFHEHATQVNGCLNYNSVFSSPMKESYCDKDTRERFAQEQVALITM